MALINYPEFIGTRAYQAQQLRYMLEHAGMQEGVYGATDLKVVQRAAGANMSVDVGAGAGWVRGDTGTRQGLYHVVNDAAVNLTVSAAHATLPRIDQVILRIFDSTVSGGSDTPTLSVLAGTATSGATLDNRTGVAALPNDAVRLADVLVVAADSSIIDSEIRDRRPWARGAHRRILRNSGGDLSTSSASQVDLDPTNLATRIECSGVPLVLALRGMYANGNANSGLFVDIVQDGVVVDGGQQGRFTSAGQSANFAFAAEWETIPSAGSHVFKPRFAVYGAGTVIVSVQPAIPLQFTVCELVYQDATN